MAQQLAALGPARSERETKRNIVQAVKETAKHLGNRPAACRKYHVHPAVFESYVEQTIFAVMQEIPINASAAAGELRASELAVLRLVKSYVGPRKEGHALMGGLCWVRKFFRAAGVTAVARQFYRVARIVAVLAAILAVARCDAVAGRMSAFFKFSHS